MFFHNVVKGDRLEILMKRNNSSAFSTERMVTAAVMTALVIIMQLLGTFTAFFGPFSTAVALLPIVIGAALCGVGIGAWLGFVFGVVVLASGGAVFFLGFDVAGTIITVLVKGVACGFVAGLAYKLLEKINRYLAVVAAAVLCPVTNTAVFLLGCAVFFMDDAARIAEAIGSSASGMGVFFALAFANFLLEVLTNLLLSPVIIKLLNIKKGAKKS